MTIHQRDKRMRQYIALEAARLMAEHGVNDYYAAKRKAAQQLGAPDTRNMPSNQEIEEALQDYQRLFKAASQPQRLKQLRAAAQHFMGVFEAFQPRLVGSVLSGTACEHSDVNLHLFTDSTEEVGFFLMQEGIPFQTGERWLRPDSAAPPQAFPTYRFMAGDVAIDLTVFPLVGIRQPPRSPVDGRPMHRAPLAAVIKLSEEGAYEKGYLSLP